MSNDLPKTPYRLLLVDGDPIFRLGFRVACEQFPDLQLVAEVSTLAAALQVLEALTREGEASLREAGTAQGVDLVILDAEGLTALDLVGRRLGDCLRQCAPRNRSGEPWNQGPALAVCQQLKAQYPNLPVLLLARPPGPALLAAQQAGALGYCPKGADISVLVGAIRLVACGQTYWDMTGSGEVEEREEISGPPPARPAPSPFAQLCRSGLLHIDATLVQVTTQLQDGKVRQGADFSSLLDWVFLSGRRRELRAAHWLVSRMLPGGTTLEEGKQGDLGKGTQTLGAVSPQPLQNSGTENQGRLTHSSSAMTPDPLPIPNSQFNLQAALFDATAVKLQSGLVNLTGVPLEIDILRGSKRRELIYVILRKIENLLDELRFSQVRLDQLPEKRSMLVRDLWEAAIADFFGKYYTLRSGDAKATDSSQSSLMKGTEVERNDSFPLPTSTWMLSGNGVEVVPVLLQDVELVQTAILDKIPLVVDFLAHVLFQRPLKVDNTAYAAGSPEAMQRSEALLQNLVIQVANGVVQPLLNNFADIEEIKDSFYDRRLLSTREIERFRNNLSWKYRLSSYFWEPQAIFESRFWLLVLQERGIQRVSIYSPRNLELDQLSGVPLAVTLVLETRDAIAPRFRAIISLIGRGFVYVLTQVVGRGLGLIGRGIIQGIGNSLQDSKWDKKSDH